MDSPGADPATRLVVPRAWMIGLAALLVVPWLIAAAIYVRRDATARETKDASGTAADPASGAFGGPRPWGQLEIRPIVISPPLEYIPTNWGPIERPQWRFPQMDRPQLEQFLSSAGMEREHVEHVLSTTRPEPRVNGVIASPDPDVVRNLTAEVRAQVYLQLAKDPFNDRQRNSFRHFASSTEAWLRPSPISPQTFSLVERFVYRLGDFVYFADIDLVRSQLEAAEMQRLAKGLLREATMLVRLHIADSSQVEAIAEYWGRGGRRTDIRPLLESIAAGGPGRSIDIVHLLPHLARHNLYRYPRITLRDFEKPSLANCFWTALNFFNTEPDDRFLDSNYAIERLKRDYYIVSNQFQLGDIVAFADASGNYFHAAVYIADDLVFGKNGASSLAPWTIVPIARIKSYYVHYVDELSVVYYRRKDL